MRGDADGVWVGVGAPSLHASERLCVESRRCVSRRVACLIRLFSFFTVAKLGHNWDNIFNSHKCPPRDPSLRARVPPSPLAWPRYLA